MPEADGPRGIADYQFTGLLGAGADGVAYLAAAPVRLGLDGDEPVVVTMLDGPADDGTFERITATLAASARVGPPHVAGLIEVGRDAGSIYHVREHLPGGSLAAPAAPLDQAGVVGALAAAARAAHVLHEAGVVHRGVAPGSVLLHPDGARLGPPRLLHQLVPGRTLTAAAAKGAVEFVDPALIRGEQATPGSDVWSLAVTLHRGLTGRGVYGDLSGTDPIATVRRVSSTPPVLDHALTPAQTDVVRACLAADPAARLATAAELADRLDGLAAHVRSNVAVDGTA